MAAIIGHRDAARLQFLLCRLDEAVGKAELFRPVHVRGCHDGEHGGQCAAEEVGGYVVQVCRRFCIRCDAGLSIDCDRVGGVANGAGATLKGVAFTSYLAGGSSLTAIALVVAANDAAPDPMRQALTA